MPKFYRQNKKRIDPRYFLNETMLREQDKEDILKDAQKLQAAGGDWNKVEATYQDAYIDGQRTAYGKAVEDKYRELEGSFSARINRTVKNLLGINRTASKVDKAFKQSGAFTNQRGVDDIR